MRDMALIGGVGALVILVAITWDLVVGVRKAAERGEARTSYGLSRTATKLLTYYGAYGVGLCIDTLLYYGNLWVLLHCDPIVRVPVVAMVIGVLLCCIELKSITEKADAKMRKDVDDVFATMLKVANKSEIAKAIGEAVAIALKNNAGYNDKTKGNEDTD